jgi:hypothetical protein
MPSQPLRLNCFGPFRFVGDEDENIFTSKTRTGQKRGVYLLTVPLDGKYLVYYVGETGNSFSERLLQHVRCYLDGYYRLYNPEKFAIGDKELIWGGMWKRERKDPRFISEFIESYSILTPKIAKFISQFCIFVIPLEVDKRLDKRLGERVEATIKRILLEQEGKVGEFQDRDIRYRPKRPKEQPLSVILKFSKPIMGLVEEISI